MPSLSTNSFRRGLRAFFRRTPREEVVDPAECHGHALRFPLVISRVQYTYHNASLVDSVTKPPHLSLEVGDIIQVLATMVTLNPDGGEIIWLGARRFGIFGFFPKECCEVIAEAGDFREHMEAYHYFGGPVDGGVKDWVPEMGPLTEEELETIRPQYDEQMDQIFTIMRVFFDSASTEATRDDALTEFQALCRWPEVGHFLYKLSEQSRMNYCNLINALVRPDPEDDEHLAEMGLKYDAKRDDMKRLTMAFVRKEEQMPVTGEEPADNEVDMIQEWSEVVNA